MDMTPDVGRRLSTCAFFVMIAGPLAAAVGFPMLPEAWATAVGVAGIVLGILAAAVYSATHRRG